ncbi:mobilization protein MobA, partial [Lacticaseibacillus paracasei]
PSGAPHAASSPDSDASPPEHPPAPETPLQAPQEPSKPITTKKALTDRFKTRLDERLAENERKQAEKQAEPDMEETWDLSDPADPLNIGMGWGTGGHGLGL